MKNFIKIFSLSLLMGSIFTVNAMDTELSIKDSTNFMLKRQTPKVTLDLRQTITLFENKDWATAYKGFKRLCDAGGMIGSAYMAYMEKEGYVSPTVVYGHSNIEPIPEIGQALSKQYLDASLAFMEPELEVRIKKLASLILNRNAHAVSLMYTLCKQDGTLFNRLLSSKQFKREAKKYKSSEDLFKNLTLNTEPFICWSCVDPDYLVYLHKNMKQSSFAQKFTITELAYFATNYEKKPEWLGNLALKLAITNDSKQVSQPLFWAHLVLENGLGELCGTLGSTLFDQLVNKKRGNIKQKEKQRKILSFSSEQRDCLDLSRYYSSKIQKNDLLPTQEVFKLLQRHGADYNRGTHGKVDESKGFLFDQKAADLGSSASQHDVAVKFWHGNGVEKNLRQAIKYFELAAAQNNKNAFFNLGVIYKDENDIKQALHYFKLAEMHGDQEAKEIHIKLLFQYSKDLESLRAYADEGDTDAQFKYAIKLKEKADNAQNSEESHKLYEEVRNYLELAAAQNELSAKVGDGR